MELRHLRYFRAVAEMQNFTRAARSLHVSQSAVSGQIRDLEREIGVKLLSRNHRDVSLTPEGAVFLREACEILDHSQRAAELAGRAARGEVGKLAIALCGPATAPFLPKYIREFRKRYPGVSLSLNDMTPAQQLEALAAGEIDVGFTRAVPPQYRKQLIVDVLYREPVIAALPRGHRLSGNRVIALSKLASERFVVYFREGAPDMFDTIAGICKRAGFSPHIACQPTLLHTVLTLVEAGEGIGLAPECVRHLKLNGITLHAIKPSGVIDLAMAYRKMPASAACLSFVDLVRRNKAEVAALMQGTENA